jgi:hypothetical protein
MIKTTRLKGASGGLTQNKAVDDWSRRSYKAGQTNCRGRRQRAQAGHGGGIEPWATTSSAARQPDSFGRFERRLLADHITAKADRFLKQASGQWRCKLCINTISACRLFPDGDIGRVPVEVREQVWNGFDAQSGKR